MVDASNFNCTNAANEFNTQCYATGTSTSDHLWRGYSFEVESPSQVSHLIGGATAGQFTVGLYRASPTNKMVPETLLGYLPFVGTGVQTSGAILLPSGEVGTVTLQPNTTYFIAQGRSSSSTTGVGLSVTGLNHVALEQSPLIKSGTWTLPSPSTHAYYWGNVGGERLILTYAATSTPVFPAIGVHYGSHSNTIVSSGLIVHLDAGNEFSYSTSTPTRWVNLVTFENAVLGGTIPPASTFNATVGSLNFTNQTFHMGKVLNNGSSFTYEAWVKPARTDGTHVIFGSQGSPLYYHINRLHGGVNPSQAIVQVNNLTPYAPVGKWQHLVMTYDHATKVLYLNINGVRVVNVTGSSLSYVSNNMYIGSHFGHSDTLFNGEISQIRIYDRALTSEEALQNFSATSVPTGMAGSIALFSPTSTEGNFITLNPNGASQAPQTVSVRIGDTFTVTSPGFTRTGHSFNGFVDESGVSYQVGDTFIPTQRMILYAQWIPGTYNVSFDANLGTGEMTPQAIVFNQSAELSPNSFARTGYRFNRWATNPNNTGTFYNDNSSFLMNVEGQTLYAQWLPNTYDVVYDANLGTAGTMANTPIVFATSAALRANSFTRTGYAFARWNTQADGLGTNYNNTASFPMNVTGQTLYAQWNPLNYTISFNQQSGSGGTASVVATYDAFVPGGLVAPTRLGHSFAGYFQAVNGAGLQYYDASMTPLRPYEINSNTTLYAHWTPNFYNVTFDPLLGSGVMEPQLILFGQSALLNPVEFTRTGYRFWRWNINTINSSTFYADQQSFPMNTEGRTLYAFWQANNYDILYHENAGAQTIITQARTFDSTAALRANTFARTGYSFVKWNTEPDGSGTDYANQVSFPMNVLGISLYAQWSPNSYNVTFNANGGAGTMTAQSIVFDQSVPLRENTFTRARYTFAGWNTLANGTGVSYAQGASYPMTSLGATLYAQWEPISYNVTFNANLGSGVMNPQPIPFNLSRPLNSNEFTRTGYRFNRWTTLSNNTGTVYADNASLTMNAEGITLFANWIANSYDIVYDGNQATGGTMANTPVNFNSTVTLRANSFSRIGYAFAGWNTQADGQGTAYTNSNTLVPMNQLGFTLYAQWTPIAYNVTFNANAGTGTMANQSILFDSSGLLIPNTFTRNGFTFAGWNTLANGTGTAYAQGASYTMTSTGATLFAQWDRNSYTFTFDTDGGTQVDSITTLFEGAVSVPSPTKEGYQFRRWSPALPSTMPAENRSFTAEWIINTRLVGSGLLVNLDAGNPNSYSTANPTVWINLVTMENAVVGGSIPPASNFSAADGSLDFTGQRFHLGKVLNTNSGFTYEAWVRPDSLSAMFVFGSNSSSLFFWGPDRLYGGNWNGSSWLINEQITVSTTVNYWQHLILSYNEQTKQVFLNMNGVRIATKSNITLNYSPADLHIGSQNGSSYIFDGEIAQIRVYGRGLSEEEALQNFYTTAIDAGVSGNTKLFTPLVLINNLVTYEPNGAAAAAETQHVQNGTNFTVASSFTRPGYTLTGFNRLANGTGTSYAMGDRITSTQNMTLYAQWAITQYAITYAANEGILPADAVTSFTVEDVVTLPTPMREHYTFSGWATNEALTGDKLTQLPSGTSSSLSLYATYTENPYAITYVASDAVITAPITQYSIGSGTITLPLNVQRTGYQFTGWVDEFGASISSFDASNSPEDRTFTAQFTPISYSITYQMNWGFNAPSNPTNFTIEDTIVFASGSKSAYDFAGFYDNPGLTGAPFTQINAGTTQDITLYAKWTPIAIPGRFQLNWEFFEVPASHWNGKSYPGTKEEFTNGFATLSDLAAGTATIATYPNAEDNNVKGLLRWSNISDLREVIVSIPGNVVDDFALRLDGYFIPSQTGVYTFAITGDDATDLTLSGPGISGEWTIGRYGGNGMGVLGTETSASGSIELVAGTIYQIMIRQQEHRGAEGLKVGWQHPGQTTTYSVYADELFSDSPSKITFEANTASGEMAPRLIVVNQPIQLSSNQFIKVGHNFTGWNTLPDGTGVNYENVELINPTGDLTLYAQWEVVTFQLSFDAAGGSEVASIQQPFNTVVIAPTNPTQEGFTFTGWSPALPATMPGVNSTHTAQWTANPYIINFDATGGTADETSKSVLFGRAVGSLPSAQRTGYTLNGWFNEATSGTLITRSTTVSTPSNVTLFAQWTPINYSITFNTGGGSLVANQTVTIETDEFTLPIPTKLASVFTGWTTQSNRQGSGISMISSGTTASMTLYAMWEPQPFYANQPLLIVIPESLYESMGDETNLTFTAEGMPNGVEFDAETKTFSGTPVPRNNLEEESFVVILTIAGNGLSEQYEIAIRVMYGARIFFITNGGAEIATRDVARSTALEAPTPIRLGYQFVAWHENADLTVPFNWASGVVQSQTTLYAQWTPTSYTITIVDGGDSLSYPQTYTIESSEISLPTPSRVGLIFQSWSDDGRIPAGSTGNRTFTASWSPRNFTLTILADGRQVSRSSIPFGSSLASINLGTPPAKVGHTATGWDRSLPSTMPSENITVNALYTVQSYPFIALDDEGKELTTTNVNFNAAVPFPTPPTKEGFTFVRWTPNTATMPANSLTVRAEYAVAEFDVTFVDNEGNNLGSAKVAFGAPVTAIEPPEIEGKVFVEWTGLPESMPAAAVRVTAVYEDVEVVEDEETEETDETKDEEVAETLDESIPTLPSRRSTTPIIIPEVILPDNPDPVITSISVNGINMNVSIIPGQPVGVLPQATLGGYNFQGWMNAITGEMITPDTVINNPDYVVLVPLFEKAPSLLDAAKNVFQAMVQNPFAKPVLTNDLTTRTDNIQSNRVTPNQLLETISIPGGLNLEVRADGSVVIPLPNETTPLTINVRGLDATTVRVYYTLGTDVPEHHDAQWKPYSGQPFLTNQPNQNVFLMVKDAYETNQVTFLRTATFVTNADKIPVTNFIQVSSNERLESLVNTKQHTFLTQVEYENTMVDMFVIEPRNEDDLIEILVRYRANDHNKSLLLDVEAFTWFEELILPGTSLGVYLRTGDMLDFTIEYRFLGRESVLESFQVTNSTTGVGILLPVQPNMFLRAILGLLIVSTIAAPYVIKPKE